MACIVYVHISLNLFNNFKSVLQNLPISGLIQWIHWSKNHITDFYWPHLLPAFEAYGG